MDDSPSLLRRLSASLGGLRKLSAPTLAFFLAGLSLHFTAGPARAIPAFARRYEAQCSMCHSRYPALNQLGARFKEDGYVFEGEEPVRGPWEWNHFFPISLHAGAGYRGNATLRQGAFLIDGIQLLVAAPVARWTSVYLHHHLISQNEPGGLHEAALRIDRPGGIPASFILGTFEPPLANSPGKTIPTRSGYSSYYVRIGSNTDAGIGISHPGVGTTLFLGPSFRVSGILHKESSSTGTLARVSRSGEWGDAGFFGGFVRSNLSTERNKKTVHFVDDSPRVGIDGLLRATHWSDIRGLLVYARHANPSGTDETASYAGGFGEIDATPLDRWLFAARYEFIRMTGAPTALASKSIARWPSAVRKHGEDHGVVAEPVGPDELLLPIATTSTSASETSQWAILGVQHYFTANAKALAEYKWRIDRPDASSAFLGCFFAF